VTLLLNGKQRQIELDPKTPLLWALRDELGLVGTKYGCGIAQCGACTVHVDGIAVKSCTMLAVQAEGATVDTIEGLANGDELHPMQAAFRENHGLQCGFCTPGVVLGAIDLLARNADPSEAQVREWLEGNLCRCTGYQQIIDSVEVAAVAMRDGEPSPAGEAT